LRLGVLRRCPLLFYEKCQTTEQDGQVQNPILTEAEEDQRRMEFEKHMLKAVEKLTDSLERELEKVSKRSQMSDGYQRRNLCCRMEAKRDSMGSK
jgi:ribosome-associated translation inhibitor RaiA